MIIAVDSRMQGQHIEEIYPSLWGAREGFTEEQWPKGNLKGLWSCGKGGSMFQAENKISQAREESKHEALEDPQFVQGGWTIDRKR